MKLREYIYGCIFFLGLACVFALFSNMTEGFQVKKPLQRIAVITSIFGGYDDLKEPDIKSMNLVDWYCFTDSTSMTSKVWNIINTQYHLQNDKNEYMHYHNYYNNITDPKTRNMMSAKYYKIKPHEIDILQDYDYYIWVDGSIILQPNFLINMITHINNNYELINFKHSARDNIYDEMKLSITMNKYQSQDIETQYNDYIAEGFPDNLGLFECTIMVKKNTANINSIFDMWWIQNLKYTYQDQISYPYCLWKNGKYTQYLITDNVFYNKEYSHSPANVRLNH